MPFLVLGLGLLMAAAGLSFMAIGWPVIQVERGWSMVIAGATMLAGGLVTAALGLVLRAIDRLGFKAAYTAQTAANPDPAKVTGPTLSMDKLEPVASQDLVDTQAHVDTEEPLEPSTPLESPVAAEPEVKDRPHPVRRMPGPKVFDVPPPPLESDAPVDKSPVETPKAAEPELSPPIDDWLDRDLESRKDDPVEAPTQPEIPPQEPSEPEPASPTVAVVGRYEADGTSYVMYADGSIEAQSPAGVYRFSSMAELKAFIEG